MKKIALILFTVIFLASCNTTTTVLSRPSRPVLEVVSESVPIEAQRNILALMTYARRLETVVDQYESMVK